MTNIEKLINEKIKEGISLAIKDPLFYWLFKNGKAIVSLTWDKE